jgi:hypothetical protein
MKVELPKTRPYGALFAVGNRLSGSAVQEIGAIIVKAGYLLTLSSGPDTHVMAPDPDAAASALVLEDQGNTGTDGMDVTREADVAPFKPVSDIVVAGFLADLTPAGAEVRVNGTLWLTRSEPNPPLPAIYLADRNRNLFGYQPRNLAPRRDEAGNPLSAPVPDPLEPEDFPLRDAPLLADIVGYDNRVLNFHRRGGGFTAAAAVSGALVAGQRITVRKAGNDALSVTLSHPPLTALYRTYCGTGPDKPPYWTRIRLGLMRADTLILRPDVGRAEVIWRSVWPWADEPVDSYRAIRVSEGGV